MILSKNADLNNALDLLDSVDICGAVDIEYGVAPILFALIDHILDISSLIGNSGCDGQHVCRQRAVLCRGYQGRYLAG